jgi:hypothetical protein
MAKMLVISEPTYAELGNLLRERLNAIGFVIWPPVVEAMIRFNEWSSTRSGAFINHSSLSNALSSGVIKDANFIEAPQRGWDITVIGMDGICQELIMSVQLFVPETSPVLITGFVLGPSF